MRVPCIRGGGVGGESLSACFWRVSGGLGVWSCDVVRPGADRCFLVSL